MIPNSRQTLIDYCLRNLGAPVLEINVDQDQIEDRVDEALQFYREYHSDSIYHDFFKHEITQEDRDNEYIPIPDAIINVVKILPLSYDNSSVSMFDARYQMALNDMYNLGFAGSLSNYVHVQNYISTVDMMINGTPQVEFNRHMNRLYLNIDWEYRLQVGEYVVVEGYRVLDPNEHTDVYNDMFLKRYLTALLKRQWGINLKKFEGMELPGGVTLNGQQMYDEATEEIQQIEEEMQLKYEYPIDFHVG
jgi:hypothetical protein